MCGIVAYIGEKQAFPIILEGLKRLEYRGYDSAGISILNGHIKTVKKKGKVAELEAAAALVNARVAAQGHKRVAETAEAECVCGACARACVSVC